MRTSSKSAKPKLTPTEAKVVKAKIKAEITDTPQSKIAQEVFPNATPASAATLMSRELKKVDVQEALQIALAEHGLTAETLAGTVGEAMSATKAVTVDGELMETGIADHSIRLKAAGMAANWMGIGKQSDGNTTNLNFINVSRSDKSDYGL